MNAELGERLKKFREMRNFTQEYVAQQLDMTPQGYGKIERNEVEVSIQRLETIAKILGTTIQDIFSFDERVIFNNTDFKNNHFMSHHSSDTFEIKEVYEERIKDLQKEITFLRTLLEKTFSGGQ